MRLLTVVLLLEVCLPAAGQTDPKDRGGCVDSQVLTRMPGCFIYSCRISNYNTGQFPVKGQPDQKVEGAAEEYKYHCARETSSIEIVRNAEHAMKKAGFAIRYQVDGSGWAGVTGQKGPQWVYVETRNGEYTLRAIRAKALEQQMEANAAGWAQQIEQTGRASIYGINFDTGKASIRTDSEKVLAEVLALLQKNATWRLAVVGHTDNVGANEMNLGLSRQRAQSVTTWLTAKGIGADRLLPGGFGDLAPVAENTTENGRAKNRRVDLIKLY